eukprot:TRINITY_DN4370_c0_g1_i1.p1 TRINITY_DN4370_c0_g1~~TRINITY_DN4370_c0_g1_i1.p1  ORF type:complete len:704 (-),score=110.23 TRINITY_DN4370_c0_g1_i1:100-2211(-)
MLVMQQDPRAIMGRIHGHHAGHVVGQVAFAPSAMQRRASPMGVPAGPVQVGSSVSVAAPASPAAPSVQQRRSPLRMRPSADNISSNLQGQMQQQHPMQRRILQASSVAAPPGQMLSKAMRRSSVAATAGAAGVHAGMGQHLANQPSPSPPVPPPQAQPKQARPQQPQNGEPPALHCAPSLPSAWTSAFELDPQAPVLGGGAFAQVLRVKERATGQTFAVKVLSRPAFACRGIESQIWAELSALRRCAEDSQGRGARVVHLVDVAEDAGLVYLRLRLCNCDLQQVADSSGGILAEADTRRWAAQLMEGLRDLHSLGILHRDIKPANILLSDGCVRIADFGWCTDVGERSTQLAGTFQYMAPEVLRQKEAQTSLVDLWSSGITIFQLLTGRHLLSSPRPSGLSHQDPQRATAAKINALLAEIGQLCPMGESSRPRHLSQVCWGFLCLLLEVSPTQRASARTALAHAWVREFSRHFEAKSPTTVAYRSLGQGREDPKCKVNPARFLPVSGDAGKAPMTGTSTSSGVSVSTAAPDTGSSTSGSGGGGEQVPTPPPAPAPTPETTPRAIAPVAAPSPADAEPLAECSPSVATGARQLFAAAAGTSARRQHASASSSGDACLMSATASPVSANTDTEVENSCPDLAPIDREDVHLDVQKKLRDGRGPAMQEWVMKMTRLLREIQEKARGLREGMGQEALRGRLDSPVQS